MKLDLSVEKLLTTTRSVRKRLDLNRPVPRAVIEECLDWALQAPNGCNINTWRWIVVDDRDTIARLAELYNAAAAEHGEVYARLAAGVPRGDRLTESAISFSANLGKVPALLVPLMPGRADGKSVAEQAIMWGSIVQAVWSFFLALRERGLGSAWTTLSLYREKEVAGVLGIPFSDYTQVGLFPIAYTLGSDFKRAWRKPVAEVMTYNRFQSL